MLLGPCTSRTPNAECAARQDVQDSQWLGRRCTIRVEHRLGGRCSGCCVTCIRLDKDRCEEANTETRARLAAWYTSFSAM